MKLGAPGMAFVGSLVRPLLLQLLASGTSSSETRGPLLGLEGDWIKSKSSAGFIGDGERFPSISPSGMRSGECGRERLRFVGAFFAALFALTRVKKLRS